MTLATGSISTLWGVSGGIEPIFSFSYTRKTESLNNKDTYYKVFTPIVKDYMEKHNIKNESELPGHFVCASDLTAEERINMQSIWQKHVDASISSTVNLPHETTVEEVKKLYILAWQKGLKGLTVYRAGCKREGILTTNEPQKASKGNIELHNTISELGQLKRGEWERRPKNIIEVNRKVRSGCGKMALHISVIPSEKRVFDVYITNSSKGGCQLSIQNLAITISNLLRSGGNLQSLRKSYEGSGVCPSYARARAKGCELSQGNSCGASILNALLKVENDLKNDNLAELKELGYYSNNKLVKKTENMVDIEAEKQKVDKKTLCPSCKNELEQTGGCVVCPNCGWSKCE